MSHFALQQVDKATYDRIARDYFTFIAATNIPDKEPVRVFSPLSEKMLGELELIRNVSLELQEKKNQEIARQKADADARESEEDGETKSKTEGENKTEAAPEEQEKKEE